MRAWGGAGGGDFGSLGKPGAGSVLLLLLLLLRPAARPFLSRFCLGFASGPFWGGFGPFWGGFGGVRGVRGEGVPGKVKDSQPKGFWEEAPPRAQNPPKMAQNDPSRAPPQAPTPRSPYHPTGGVIGIQIINIIIL